MTERKGTHITKEMFECWQQGEMNEKQEEEFLEHTGTCTFCAEQFGSWMEQDLMEPPAYLKDEIIRRTQQLDVQTVVKVKKTSKQVQLMGYSLKVGLAVVASIFLLTISTKIPKMSAEIPQRQSDEIENIQKQESITDKLNRGSSFVTDALNQMTDGVFGIE